MRLRLALAFLVSIALIGAASWFRLTTSENAPSNIVAVEQFGTSDVYDGNILRDFLEPKATSTTSVETTLSNTDLIGRQLILDYVGLAASGGAGPESIDALANKYIDNLPALNDTPSIGYADIKTVPNTKSNFQNYADEITKIYIEYAERISKASIGGDNLNTLNPALYSFALTFNAAYIDAALKLQNLSVPASLAPIHLQLVNSYLSSAAATKAVSETEEDSAAAFAGLVILNKNVVKEKTLINEIDRTLISNGI